MSVNKRLIKARAFSRLIQKASIEDSDFFEHFEEEFSDLQNIVEHFLKNVGYHGPVSFDNDNSDIQRRYEKGSQKLLNKNAVIRKDLMRLTDTQLEAMLRQAISVSKEFNHADFDTPGCRHVDDTEIELESGSGNKTGPSIYFNIGENEDGTFFLSATVGYGISLDQDDY